MKGTKLLIFLKVMHKREIFFQIYLLIQRRYHRSYDFFRQLFNLLIGINVGTFGTAKSCPGTRLYPINSTNPKTNLYHFHLQLELLFLLMHKMLTYLLKAVNVLSI